VGFSQRCHEHIDSDAEACCEIEEPQQTRARSTRFDATELAACHSGCLCDLLQRHTGLLAYLSEVGAEDPQPRVGSAGAIGHGSDSQPLGLGLPHAAHDP
jgi:hypothetical protein